MVRAADIKLSSTAYSNSYSNLVVNWPRPNDGNPVSCITEYIVEVFRVSFEVLEQQWEANQQAAFDPFVCSLFGADTLGDEQPTFCAQQPTACTFCARVCFSCPSVD